MAVLFPPWWDGVHAYAAAAAAGAMIVRAGAWPSLLVVRGFDATLAARLRQQGAWIMMDAIALRGCSAEEIVQ